VSQWRTVVSISGSGLGVTIGHRASGKEENLVVKWEDRGKNEMHKDILKLTSDSHHLYLKDACSLITCLVQEAKGGNSAKSGRSAGSDLPEDLSPDQKISSRFVRTGMSQGSSWCPGPTFRAGLLLLPFCFTSLPSSPDSPSTMPGEESGKRCSTLDKSTT
jgi:hypothetical protein